jgi:hypothetical protein
VDGWRLSVDYGSSHTVAVLARPDGSTRPLNFDATPLLSSAIWAEPGGALLTGQDSHAAALRDPARFEPHPKRQIDAGTVLLGDRQIPVADLIAATLRRVAEEAVRVTGGAAVEAVFTYPASWGPARRATLRTAAEAAGFAAPAMLAEPVAAAQHFVEAAVPPFRHDVPMVVYDLGGGTFDVSLVRGTADGMEILASDGQADLGGIDLDALVVDLVREGVAATDPASWARLCAPATVADRRHFRLLWEAARQAKESLSRRPTATVAVPLLDREVHITREQFERAAGPVLALTVDQTVGMLRRAGLRPGELAGVLLVGGATRTPLVATLLHRATGTPPTVLDQPELVVAEGALRNGRRNAAPPPRASSADVPATAGVPATASPPAGAPPSGLPASGRPAAETPHARRAATAAPGFRSHGSRGRALGAVAFTAVLLIGGLWYATSHSTSLANDSVGMQAFGIALLVGLFGVLVAETVRLAVPDVLIIDRSGIHTQRLRFGRGLQRLSLPWVQVREALVEPVQLVPTLVVRTHLGPRDGATLTGRRYRPDVTGYALCALKDIGATTEQVRAALTAHAPH